MWEELQQHRPVTTSLETIKKWKEEDSIFKLLAGIGTKFDNVCSSMLIMQALPSFNSMCAMIQWEEKKKVMLEVLVKKEISGASSSSVACLVNNICRGRKQNWER